MFKFPYETTTLSSHVLSGTVSALQHAAVEGQLVAARTANGLPIEGLFMVPPYLKQVQPFAHPLQIEVTGRQMMVLDMRAFTREDRMNNNELRVTNPNEYELLMLRGRLSQAWVGGYASEMRSIGAIVPQVYARLVSEAIVRRLGLGPMDQQYLSVLAAYFYFCQFTDETQLDETEAARYAQRVATTTMINAQAVLKFLDMLRDENGNYPILTNLDSFVGAVRKVSNSPRMEALNIGLIVGSISSVWFGASAREVVAVSLEYPPTFIALIYAALTDRTFHGAPLTKLVIQCDRRDAGQNFVKSLSNFLEMTSHA